MERRVENHVILGELPEAKTVTFTFDGEEVEAREGEMILAVPKDQVEEVRSIKRRAADTNFVLKQIEDGTAKDNILVCRCEEVTLCEIKKAIADGARTVTGVKLRTRAGMGLCQEHTCGKMVQAILRQQLGNTPEEISFSTNRPPVRPTTFGSIAGGDDNE